jgi:hypothetical protein
MERGVMSKIVKADNWDGKSRPSNKAYDESWNRIFGKKENDQLAESLKQSIRNKKKELKVISNYRIGQRSNPGDGGRFLAAMSTLVRVSSSFFSFPVKSTTTTIERK